MTDNRIEERVAEARAQAIAERNIARLASRTGDAVGCMLSIARARGLDEEATSLEGMVRDTEAWLELLSR